MEDRWIDGWTDRQMDGVRDVARDDTSYLSIYLSIREVLTVDAPHAAAVNAALGEALASVVVVEDAPTAAEAVRRFREERVGLVSCLVLDLTS